MKQRKTTTRHQHLRTVKSGKVTAVRQHPMKYWAVTWKEKMRDDSKNYVSKSANWKNQYTATQFVKGLKRADTVKDVKMMEKKGKDKLIPVRQHNRTIGYVKERALSQMMQPAKKVDNPEFRRKVSELKMRPIDEQVEEGLERLESEKKSEKKGIFDDLLDSFAED